MSQFVVAARPCWVQPQRHMGRLYRLMDHCEQCLTYLIQFHLVAQGSAEGSQRAGRIIFAAIEATINDSLNPTAQGLKECSNGQCRSNDHDGRLRGLPGNEVQQRL